MLYLWIGLAVILTIVTGICLYFLVFDVKLTGVSIKDSFSSKKPGASIELELSGSYNTNGTKLEFSSNGKDFTEFLTTSDNTKKFTWDLPNTVASSNCQIRATLKNNTVYTQPFAILPTFTIDGLPKSFIGPGDLTLKLITELDGVQKVDLLTSTDGTTFTAVPSTSAWKVQNQTIVWTINQGFPGIYLRVSVSNRPDITYTSTDKMDIQCVGSTARFTTLTAYSDDIGTILASMNSPLSGYVQYNQNIYVDWTSIPNVNLAGIEAIKYQSYDYNINETNWATVDSPVEVSSPTQQNLITFPIFYNPRNPSAVLPTVQVTHRVAIRIETSDASLTLPGINIGVYMKRVGSIQYTQDLTVLSKLRSLVAVFQSAAIKANKTWRIKAAKQTDPLDIITIAATASTIAGQVTYNLTEAQANLITRTYNVLTFESTTVTDDMLSSGPIQLSW